MSYESKELNSIINDIILNVVENVDAVTDANVGGVMRQLIESISTELSALYTQLNAVYDGTRITTATADDLEELGKLVGVTRKAGTKAIGDVTFVRASIAGSDFNIAGGLILSTQPNTGDTVLRFITSSQVTFDSSVVDESHTFTDGKFDYRMDERFVGQTTSVAITGTYSSAAYVFTSDVDFYIQEDYDDFLVTEDTTVVIDDCDTADWTQADDATADATDSDKKQGNYSLALGKSGTATIYASYSKTLSAVVDGTSKYLVIWLKIEDATALAKIDEIEVWIGSGGDIVNSYKFTLDNSDLVTGWAKYRFSSNAADVVIAGVPSIISINHLKLRINTNLISDTLTTADVLMDLWQFSETEDYIGDLVSWKDAGTKPDTDSDFDVDYTPLSKEVPCVAEVIGADYNVSRNKIITQVSNIPNINTVNNYEIFSGGTDEELDAALRERILFAAELQGKATAEAIRQAVLAVDGVTSVSVDDLPLQSTTSETHLFSTGVAVYTLDREILYLDSTTSPTNIEITGLLSATTNTFVYGTDYTAQTNADGQITSAIEWQGSGDNPDDNTLFEVDYQYDWLGHVDVFVAGTENPLPTTVLAAVETAVDEAKAAGVTVDVIEPSIVQVDVTATITADSANSYTFAGIQTSIESAVKTFLNTLDVGQDVFVAELYSVIMGVTGVFNSSITDPAVDATIATDEVAKPGTITITEA